MLIDRGAATKHNNEFFRAALVMGTFTVSLGLTYWIPNMIFETFRLQVPVWYLLNQEVFVSVRRRLPGLPHLLLQLSGAGCGAGAE